MNPETENITPSLEPVSNPTPIPESRKNLLIKKIKNNKNLLISFSRYYTRLNHT